MWGAKVIADAPLALALPGGVLAEYVAGSDPPQYALDGAPIAVDVTIPDDLAALGWRWEGSFFCCDGGDPLRPVFVATNTYPPPGWPCDRRDCFEVARGIDWSPVAPVTVKPAKKAKRPTKSAQPVQLAMELV